MKRNSKKIISSAAAFLLSLAVVTDAMPSGIFSADNYSISVSADEGNGSGGEGGGTPSTSTGTSTSSGTTTTTTTTTSSAAVTTTTGSDPVTYDNEITYLLDGGTNAPQNPAGFNNGDDPITLAAPTKKGYSFDGWSSIDFQGNELSVTIDPKLPKDQEYKTYTANWKPNSYTVCFKANGGSGQAMANMDFTYSNQTPLTANTYTPQSGKFFYGWNTKANGSGDFYADASSADALIDDSNTNKVSPDIIYIYAQWAPVTHTIKYNANGGEGTAIPDQTHTKGDSSTYKLSANTFTRKHYTFDGWTDSANGTEKKYNDQAEITELTQKNNVVNLYALWKGNTYDVVLHANDGAKDSSNNPIDNKVNWSFTYGTAAKLSDKDTGFAITGKSIKSWNTVAAPTTDNPGKTYSSDALADSIVPDAEPTAPIELYAQWDKAKYTITYKGLDGLPAETVSTYPKEFYIDSQTVTLPTPSKAGYTFDGWTEGSSTEKKTTVTIATGTHENKTFTAHWTANNYTIAFSANASYTTGTMANISAVYAQNVTLTQNAFARTGYKFKEWNTVAAPTTSTPGVSYADKASVSNLTGVKNGTATLYAQWKPISYKVVFNSGSGTGSMSPQEFVYGTAQELTACGFTKSGKVFAGWGTSSTATEATYSNKQQVNNLSSTENGTVELYAIWSDNNKYTVEYNDNGSTSGSAMTAQQFVMGKPQKIKTCSYKKTGYTFSVWNTSPDGSGTSFSAGQTANNLTETPGETVTLYAQWTPVTYKVTYDLNGGSGGTPVTQTAEYDTTVTLKKGSGVLTKKGFVFGGWNTKANGSGTSYDEGEEITVTADLKLYASWVPNTYTIKFDANGGTGTMGILQCTYGTKQTLTANAFTRPGHDFENWNTSSYGTGTKYSNKASVNNLTEVNNKTITLYAQWKAKTYTITFNKGTSTGGTMKAQKFTYGDGSKLTANAYTKTGEIFVGWNTKADGSGILYKDEEPTADMDISSEKITLYAQWKTQKYTLTLPKNMEITENASADGLYDKGQTVKFKVSSGYVIDGDVKNGSSVLTDNDGVYSVTFEDSNITVTASTSKIKHKIYYKVNGELYKTVEAEHGTTIVLIPAPSKNGYIFSGWKNAPREMPDNDITIVGTFTATTNSPQDGSTTASSVTTTEFTGPLGKVTGIKVDSSGNITWDELPGAVNYKAAKIVDKTTYYGKLTSKTSYKLIGVPQEDYQVFVVAFAKDGSSTRSEPRSVKVNVKLGAVTGVTVDSNGVVKWNKTENAVSYVVAKVVGSKTYFGKSTSKTTYKFASVPKVAYKVYVIASNINDETVASNVLTAYPNGSVLYPVTNVTADSSGKVTWTATDDAAFYRVTRKANGQKATSAKITDTKYQFISVPSTDFEVYVTAYNSKGNYVVSDTVKVKVADLAPEKVIGVKADSDGNISWAASKNAVYYRASKVVNGKVSSSAKLKTLSYKFISVPDTDFSVYVTAYSATGKKSVSDTIKIKASKKLGAAKNIVIDSSGAIKWSAASNAVYYKVVRKVGSNITFSKNLTVKKYSFSTVPTSVYTVYITSYDADGNSVKSEVVTIDPAKMAPVSVTNDGTVTWKASDKAEYYKVTRVSAGIVSTSKAVKDTKYKLLSVPSGRYEVYVTAFDASGNAVRSSTVKAN